MHAAPSALGLDIPVRAVERITRRTGTHRALQAIAIEPALHRAAHRCERRDNAVRRLAIARVRHTLAAAAMRAVVKLGHHHDRLSLAAAADGKRAGERPAFDADGELHG